MQITKTFGMAVSANYQTYRFESTLSMDTSDLNKVGIDCTTPEAAENYIGDKVISMVHADIDAYASVNPDFNLVWSAREREFAKYRGKS